MFGSNDRTVSPKMCLSVVVLVLVRIDLAATELFPMGRCQFMTPCDISLAFSPLVDALESRVELLAAFEEETTHNYAECIGRMEILEDQLGMPYYKRARMRPASASPESSSLENESSATRYMRRLGLLFTDTPLVKRVDALDEWKKRLEEETIPTLTSNMNGLLRQMASLSSLVEKLESEKVARRLAEENVITLQKVLKAMQENNSKNSGEKAKEDLEKTNTIVSVHNLRHSVDEVLSKMTSLNESVNSRLDNIDKMIHNRSKMVDDVTVRLDELKTDFDDVYNMSATEQLHFIEKTEAKILGNQIQPCTCDSINKTTEKVDKLADQVTTLDKKQIILEIICRNQSQAMNQFSTSLTALNGSLAEHVESRSGWEEPTVLRVVRSVFSPLERRLSSLETKTEKEVLREAQKLQKMEHRMKLVEHHVDGNASLLSQLHREMKNVTLQTLRLEKRGEIWDSFPEEMRKSMERLRVEFGLQKKEQQQTWPMDAPENLILPPKITPFAKKSCFLNLSDNVLASIDGRPVEGNVVDGREVKFRCREIGGFKFLGGAKIKCQEGRWSQALPSCQELLPKGSGRITGGPSIKVTSESAGVSPDGELIVPLGSEVILTCLIPTRTGVPHWKVNRNGRGGYLSGKYVSSVKGEELERGLVGFEIEINPVQPRHTGIYTCRMNNGNEHSIHINVKNVHCPPPLFWDNVERMDAVNTTMNSVAHFKCVSSDFRLHWPDGLSDTSMTCLPSGIWSREFPSCIESR